MAALKRLALASVICLLYSFSALGQSAPTSLFGCLDGNGNLYGVTPSGKLGEGCSPGDLPVSLGSAGTVNASNGLVGELKNGVVDIGVAEGLAIPPACPPGQIPISDGQGAWICTLPNFGDKNPTSKVWVLPHTQALLTELDQVSVHVLNPGTSTATVGCFYFKETGQLSFDATSLYPAFTLSSGAADRCFVRSDGLGPGWILVVSDIPVLATGTANGRNLGLGASQSRGAAWSVQPYPVNCDDPTNVEFVCSFADP
jgi:hypothetical protein